MDHRQLQLNARLSLTAHRCSACALCSCEPPDRRVAYHSELCYCPIIQRRLLNRSVSYSWVQVRPLANITRMLLFGSPMLSESMLGSIADHLWARIERVGSRSLQMRPARMAISMDELLLKNIYFRTEASTRYSSRHPKWLAPSQSAASRARLTGTYKCWRYAEAGEDGLEHPSFIGPCHHPLMALGCRFLGLTSATRGSKSLKQVASRCSEALDQSFVWTAARSRRHGGPCHVYGIFLSCAMKNGSVSSEPGVTPKVFGACPQIAPRSTWRLDHSYTLYL